LVCKTSCKKVGMIPGDSKEEDGPACKLPSSSSSLLSSPSAKRRSRWWFCVRFFHREVHDIFFFWRSRPLAKTDRTFNGSFFGVLDILCCSFERSEIWLQLQFTDCSLEAFACSLKKRTLRSVSLAAGWYWTSSERLLLLLLRCRRLFAARSHIL